MIAYFNDCFVDKNEIRISPDDRGFLFADGLYEVVRSYNGIFLGMDDHIERLNYGASQLNLKQTDFSWFKEIAAELIKRNHLEDANAMVYFQVTRGVAQRSHAFPDPLPDLTLYATASSFNAEKAEERRQKGVDAVTVPDIRWSRCDVKTTALTANVLANQAAHEQGAWEAVFVRDGVLLEGTHSNFMAVFDDVLVTAPLSNYILGGITRKMVLEICQQENIPYREGPVFEKDIHRASEMMITATSIEVTPVIRLNGQPVGNTRPGPVVRMLQKAFGTLY